LVFGPPGGVDLSRQPGHCVILGHIRGSVIVNQNEACGMQPKTEGILESSLYVEDVVRSARFYEKVFGFLVISDFAPRGLAMGAGERQVLLLFQKGGS